MTANPRAIEGSAKLPAAQVYRARLAVRAEGGQDGGGSALTVMNLRCEERHQ